MLRGYARIALHGEEPSVQIERLHAAGVEPGMVRVDRSSGTRGPRPELDAALADLRAGDVLVVTALDRLASSVLHLVAVGQRLHAIRAELWSLDEGVDTRVAPGAGLLPSLGVLSDLQRALTSSSTRAGLEAARSRGRRGGRPPRLDHDASAEARRLYDEGRSVTEIAEHLGVPRTTLYGHLHRRVLTPTSPPGVFGGAVSALHALAAGVPGAGLPPLTAGRLLTSWTAQPAVIAGVALLGGGYLAGVRRARRAGVDWSARRTTSFLLGAALLLLVGTSAVAVYDDTLFWARSVQGVVLLVIAPMLLAAGAPLTLARGSLPSPWVVRLGQVRRSRTARAVAAPGSATIALIAPPFLLYLTGLYPLELRSATVSGLVSLGLLGAGLLYVVSRLQIDPVPRETHHGLTLTIAIAEVVADGVLGLVLWMGPLLAVGHYDAVGRTWGPDLRDDQAIGAGVWWIGGDLAGLPFLGAIAVRFAAADAREARRIDAELDAAELREAELREAQLREAQLREAQRREAQRLDAGGRDAGPEPAVPGVGDGAVVADPAPAEADRPRLWWEDDPRFADRFRRS